MHVFKIWNLGILFLFISSCASSPKEKILRNMVIGAATGFALGQLKSENKTGYGLLYAGAVSSVAGAASVWYSDMDFESERIKSDNQKLKTELDKIYSPSLTHESSGMMNSKIPDKYKSMINPGQWKVYSLDQWVEDGENQLIHQDKMMELIPPTLMPAQLPVNLKKKAKKL